MQFSHSNRIISLSRAKISNSQKTAIFQLSRNQLKLKPDRAPIVRNKQFENVAKVWEALRTFAQTFPDSPHSRGRSSHNNMPFFTANIRTEPFFFIIRVHYAWNCTGCFGCGSIWWNARVRGNFGALCTFGFWVWKIWCWKLVCLSQCGSDPVLGFQRHVDGVMWNIVINVLNFVRVRTFFLNLFYVQKVVLHDSGVEKMFGHFKWILCGNF